MDYTVNKQTFRESSAKPYIVIKDLVWQPRQASRPIINSVSASFTRGVFTAILGPNGAGKTSLMKLLLGFRQPQKGQILLAERPLEGFSRKELARELAYLPQATQSHYDLPVREVVRMARYSRLTLFEQTDAQDEEAITEALRRSGAIDLAEQSFTRLSGGERQRVLCARAIAQESSFIILDEPVSNLDLRYQHTILATLRQLAHDKNVGILCVMHDVNLAKQYADEILLLKQGRTVGQGPTEELLNEALLSEVYDWPLVKVESRSGQESFFVTQAIGVQEDLTR
ncbi:MAG: ABC transporter ATP-binding protein [Eubacteriales bacterium]|nr:ABC transporter ATP-binding protein [Eubacteriales bacterium]